MFDCNIFSAIYEIKVWVCIGSVFVMNYLTCDFLFSSFYWDILETGHRLWSGLLFHFACDEFGSLSELSHVINN